MTNENTSAEMPCSTAWDEAEKEQAKFTAMPLNTDNPDTIWRAAWREMTEAQEKVKVADTILNTTNVNWYVAEDKLRETNVKCRIANTERAEAWEIYELAVKAKNEAVRVEAAAWVARSLANGDTVKKH